MTMTTTRLFQVLCAMCLHLIGIYNLIVEVDDSHIKGVLSNPNTQLNATNHWIATATTSFLA
jgi:hypothetical protein